MILEDCRSTPHSVSIVHQEMDPNLSITFRMMTQGGEVLFFDDALHFSGSGRCCDLFVEVFFLIVGFPGEVYDGEWVFGPGLTQGRRDKA